MQYLLIGLLFVAAVYYVGKRLFPSKKNQGGCGKGCGCDAMPKTSK
ncbi:FeoB-associated Cys-rich membrane protein [Sphingobacterium sp. KB22]|uniref:FeoB-associated Cys-rich membrane protein n=1 Tax=Sphingobacterium hungaricum TaxID=2082723 RepID=A0A928UXB0_9SPHI|nr:FeoB-associated Cys-rich membrane protein [Sphingobacterium hungaricum]